MSVVGAGIGGALTATSSGPGWAETTSTPCQKATRSLILGGLGRGWARLVSNQRPLACEATAAARPRSRAAMRAKEEREQHHDGHRADRHRRFAAVEHRDGHAGDRRPDEREPGDDGVSHCARGAPPRIPMHAAPVASSARI
jgi:hypothetical protein